MEMFDPKTPKYVKIKYDIRTQIEDGVLQVDAFVPSERELMELHSVSRITVRKAIDELVNEGLLYKIQGKGTFVKGGIRQSIDSIRSCTRDIISLGLTPHRKLIRQTVESPTDHIARKLELSSGEYVYVLDRVYYADKTPLNRTFAFLPEKYFPGLMHHDFSERSLYETLEENYGVEIISGIRTIEAVSANADMAKHLEIETGTPIILLQAVVKGKVHNKEIPIETYKTYYRTDNFKFIVDQKK